MGLHGSLSLVLAWPAAGALQPSRAWSPGGVGPWEGEGEGGGVRLTLPSGYNALTRTGLCQSGPNHFLAV